MDGILKRAESGRLFWHAHRVLSSAQEDVDRNGLKSRADSAKATWAPSFRYKSQPLDEAGKPRPDVGGLRPPQLGALFAVGAHWSLNTHPATIVMPTGTGKTETMLSVLAAYPSSPMVVAVPSKALRKQTVRKFLTFGRLQQIDVLVGEITYPVVGILTKRPTGVGELDIFESCNVVVGVVSSLGGGSASQLSDAIAERAEVLVVDEAHHVGAKTWTAFRAAFEKKKVLQFTATPFRLDGQLVDGEVIFSYSLKKAQEDQYFKPIKFVPVHELSTRSADAAIAAEVCKTLREDIANGFNHLAMARCETIARANEVLKIYEGIGADLKPVIIHSELPDADVRVQGLLAGGNRVVVCVNMLGEGFDLPALKIAGLHDPHKSLGAVLQFTGRFTRTADESIGDATVIANIADPEVSVALERLYSEDSDWNSLLSEMSSQAAKDHAQLIEFLSNSVPLGEQSGDLPSVSHQLLRPTMSTLTYACQTFTPKRFHEGLPEDLEVVQVWLNSATNTLFFVTRSVERVKWTRSKEIIDSAWHLFVLHHDSERGLLYVASSDKSSNHASLASAVGAGGQLSGEQIFKALGHVGRLVFNNLGVSKHGRKNLSYAMYTGADVRMALTQSEKAGSRKANLNGSGWEHGKQITIGCSYKGRVWSREGGTIPRFIEWAENVGSKLVDPSINTADIIDNVLIPEEITELPAEEVLGIEWPVELLRQSEDRIVLNHDGIETPIYLCDIAYVSCDHTANTVRFDIVGEDDAVIGEFALRVGGEDGFAVERKSFSPVLISIGSKELPIEEYFSGYPPLVRFVNLTELDGNLILKPQNPYDLSLPEKIIEVWDWKDTDIEKESIWKDGEEREDSVQWAAAQHFIEAGFGVVFDDDGAGEAADLVCIKEEDSFIRLALVHCKFAGAKKAGRRVDDVVVVASQAVRSAKWAGRFKELCKHIINRDERRRTPERPTHFLQGASTDINPLIRSARFKEVRPEIVLVQPGISAKAISKDQSMVLAAAASYLKETVSVDIGVICNE